jgi:hypothetical protein
VLPFTATMYPDRVLVRRVVDTTGPQGGVTPAPDVGVWYMASIQPKAQASLKANPETPPATTGRSPGIRTTAGATTTTL